MDFDNIFKDTYNYSVLMHNQSRDSEAIFYLEKNVVQSLNTLGLTYSSCKKYDESINCFKNALQIDPSNWIIWSNICHVESMKENYEEALSASIESIKYSKGCSFDPYYNSGVIYSSLNRCREAEDAYRLALKLKPDDFQCNYNLGLCILRQRIDLEGWQKYEYRFKTSDLTAKFKNRFIQDHWDGRKFKNKSLLVYSEQGLGDFIFYSRFLPIVKDLGGDLNVEVQEPIASVLGSNLKIDEMIIRSNDTNWPEPKETDYCISICSLPLVLKINDLEKIPNKPYIFAPKRPKPKIISKNKINVGICWAGNPDHKRDCTRSTKLENFRILSELPNIKLYGLLKNVPGLRHWHSGSVDLNEGIDSFPMTDLSKNINDFGDLSHYINHLDLIVTVDTGLAHLAGAMGKHVWMIIGKETDWRWGDFSDKTPWYPSMKIFRYKTNWQDVLREVYESLKTFDF